MDKYDEHIEAILRDKDKAGLHNDWVLAKGLFQFLGPSGCPSKCGCPTMVKSGRGKTHDGKLLDEVMNSKIIPDDSKQILPDRAMLNEFARIQRLADKIYNRV